LRNVKRYTPSQRDRVRLFVKDGLHQVAATDGFRVPIPKRAGEPPQQSMALVRYEPRLERRAESPLAISLKAALSITLALVLMLLVGLFLKYLKDDSIQSTAYVRMVQHSVGKESPSRKAAQPATGLRTSVERLAVAVRSLSRRIDYIDKQLQTNGKASVVRPPTIDTQPTVGSDLIQTAPRSPGKPLAAIQHRHQWLTGVDPVGRAVVHVDDNGIMDYWLVPYTEVGLTRAIKVLPFAESSMGVSVHNLENGQDFILTASGGWIGIDY
jgi:hypothetical protein